MPPRLRRNRQHVNDPNLVNLPGTGYGPVPVLPLERGFPELRDTYLELLRAFSPPIDHDDRPGDPSIRLIPRNLGEFYPKGYNSTYHLMNARQRELADSLYRLICDSISVAYTYGLEYGQDLLSQLARGEIGIGDFEHPHRKCKSCGRTLPTSGKVCLFCRKEREGENEIEDKPEETQEEG